MLGRTMKPNRNVITFTRLDNSDDEPYKKQRTIGDPDNKIEETVKEICNER